MKKHWKSPTVILMLGFMMLTASAQEIKSNKKMKIEFGIGLNFSGPQLQIGELMKIQGYDDSYRNWFTGDIITHPIYSGTGFNAHISCFYSLAPRSQIGIMLNHSGFGEVNGYSIALGYLDVRLSNFSLIPLYMYNLNEYLELQAGPALMVNSGDKYSIGLRATNEQYIDYTLGLFTGFNLKIWNRSVTFGKIGANYLLTTDSKLGPYTSEAFLRKSHIFPESSINFSHLNIVFAFGFKL
jgi:hypothetical protein